MERSSPRVRLADGCSCACSVDNQLQCYHPLMTGAIECRLPTIWVFRAQSKRRHVSAMAYVEPYYAYVEDLRC